MRARKPQHRRGTSTASGVPPGAQTRQAGSTRNQGKNQPTEAGPDGTKEGSADKDTEPRDADGMKTPSQTPRDETAWGRGDSRGGRVDLRTRPSAAEPREKHKTGLRKQNLLIKP